MVLTSTTGRGDVGEPLALAAAQGARGDDDAVDPPLGEQLEVADLAFRVVGGVAQQDRVALGSSSVLDRPHQRGKNGFSMSVTISPSVRVARSLSDRATPDGR